MRGFIFTPSCWAPAYNSDVALQCRLQLPERSKCSLTVLDKLFLSAPALGLCWGHWEPKNCSEEVQVVIHHKENCLVKVKQHTQFQVSGLLFTACSTKESQDEGGCSAQGLGCFRVKLLVCLELFSTEIVTCQRCCRNWERADNNSESIYCKLCFCGRFISDLYVYTERAPVETTFRTQSLTQATACGVALSVKGLQQILCKGGEALGNAVTVHSSGR